jgi:hypothetical protein
MRRDKQKGRQADIMKPTGMLHNFLQMHLTVIPKMVGIKIIKTYPISKPLN